MSVFERIKRFFGIESQQRLEETEQLLPESTEDGEQVVTPLSSNGYKGYKVLVRYVGALLVNRYSDIWTAEDRVYVVDKKGVKPETAIDLLKEMSFWRGYRYARVSDLEKDMPEVVVAKDESELRCVAGVFDLNAL